MTPREKRIALLGLLAGLALAALILAMATFLRPQMGAPDRAGAPVPDAATAETSQAAQPLQPEDAELDQGGSANPVNTVELSPEEEKAIGLRTALVKRRRAETVLMTVGRVEEAETRLATISARVGGRIDRLFVDFTGQNVRRGQPIAEIYSPEVVSSAEEYRLAQKNLERLDTATPQAVEQARELVAASRRRLELWGLTPEQIAEIENAAEAKVHVTIHAPVNGIVTERKVTEGQYVREGDALYRVTDLGLVWVQADVYESDLPGVRVGQRAEVTSDALPGEKLNGRISFIDPMVKPETRTVSVRIEVPNPNLRLRPAMYAHARLLLSANQPVLAVPRSAVLDTGMRKMVYVAKGQGVFEGRRVELGPPGEDYYPVLAGLREGESVVTQGSFMIDSQSRLTGGITGLFGGSKEFARAAEGSTNGGWKISFQAEPSPAKPGAENTFRVSVSGPGGQPVSDAVVRVHLLMPAMPAMGMGEMRESAELRWNGSEYAGPANIPTAGSWTVTVEATRNGQRLAMHRTTLLAR